MIKLENICFSYTGNRPYILEDLNFQVNKGDYISVLGDNGSGKSTLIKIILRNLKPLSGSAGINAFKTGYLPQRIDNFNMQFPITVYEAMDCFRKSLKIRNREIIDKFIEIINLKNHKHSLIGDLSEGQFRKIFLARAFMGEPSLLILDEPSTGIDSKSQEEIYGLIKNINKDNGVTVISVEHNLKAAVKNSTMIYHIKNGKGHMCSPEKYITEYANSCKGENCYAPV